MNFFSNIKISHKISGLMVGLVLGFVLIGIAYFVQVGIEDGAKEAQLKQQYLSKKVSSANASQLKMRELTSLYLVSPSKTTNQLRQQQIEHIESFVSDKSLINNKINTNISNLIKAYQATFREIQSTSANNTGLYNSDSQEIFDNNLATKAKELSIIGQNLDSQFSALDSYALQATARAAKIAHAQSNAGKAIFTALLFLVAISTALGMYFIYKSIVFPLVHIQSVIRRINAGKTKARVGLKTNDELGTLGQAFNKLLDERIDTLQQQSLENEQLNSSIIGLIKALSLISQKDLTVKVPVSSDITGIISDAVNLLTVETAKTLHQVSDISDQISGVSETLQQQSAAVISVAEKERNQVIQTSRALEISSSAMNKIASEAQSAAELARNAIDNTVTAKSSVSKTVNSIQDIRGTISETEKRIKRLGDRSQEITGIVNLINTIAERTHILALNASMHAASAGEAGKGFAVVAEEVQRLAEKAREATLEISAMVNNIRVETSDTVTTMNKLITQVAEGTKLAEQAGHSMGSTEASTRDLVEKVLSISQNSISQADITNKVRNRATAIRRYTEQTEKGLQQQKLQTEQLTKYSEILLERVNVFTLPQTQKQ